MFDLFRSRDKAVRILLGAILVIVALSMVTYLIPGGPGGGSGASTDNVIAQVGNDTITVQAAQRAIQAALKGNQIPQQYLAIYAPQAIQQLVAERAMAYEADRQGIKVSDDDVNVSIQNQLPAGFFKDGVLVKKEQLDQALASQGMTVADLKTDVARQLLITRLRDIALEGTIVTPKDIEQEFRRKAEKAKIEYVLLTPAKYSSEIKTDDAAMKSYYDKGHAGFQTAAKKSLAYLIFDPAMMEASIPVTDADLQREYNANRDRFRIPERVHARHILFRTDQPNAKEPEIRAKAEGVLKQLRAGGDFADLAKKNSEDTGSAVKGGDLSWVSRGQMVPPFEQAVFSQKVNQISDLVKTQYGYHIVQDLEREEAHQRSFEEVKAEIAGSYRKQRVNQVMQQQAEKAATELRSDPSHPEKAAADVNQQLLRAENVSPGDPMPMLGVSKQFEAAVGGLQKNDVSQPVVLEGNRLAVALVTNIAPAHPSSYQEAIPEIRKALQTQGLEVLLSQKASDLVAKAKENGGDLKKAAASMGLELKTSDEFTRAGSITDIGSSGMVPDAFTKPVGTVFGPISAQGNRIIAKLVSRTPGVMADLALQTATIRDEIKSRRARERNAVFEDGVRQRLEKDGKIKMHQAVIDRLIASYRS